MWGAVWNVWLPPHDCFCCTDTCQNTMTILNYFMEYINDLHISVKMERWFHEERITSITATYRSKEVRAFTSLRHLPFLNYIQPLQRNIYSIYAIFKSHFECHISLYCAFLHTVPTLLTRSEDMNFLVWSTWWFLENNSLTQIVVQVRNHQLSVLHTVYVLIFNKKKIGLIFTDSLAKTQLFWFVKEWMYMWFCTCCYDMNAGILEWQVTTVPQRSILRKDVLVEDFQYMKAKSK